MEHQSKWSSTGPSLSRRALLRTGTLGAAAAGAASAFPGLIGGLVTAGPEASGVASDLSAETPELDGMAAESATPLVAHITNASTGEMSIFVGERQISFTDAQLAQRLLRAAQ